MESIRNVQKQYCSKALAVAILICLILIAADKPDIGKGLLLGTLFSIINFVIMGELLPYRINQSRKRASLVAFLSICIRYALLAIPLFMAIKMDQFHLIATIVGIFFVQLVILAEYIGRLITSTNIHQT